MNASDQVPLIFSLTFDEFVNLLIAKETHLRRDQVDLMSRGITIVRLDAFKANKGLLLTMPQHVVENRDRSLALTACRVKKAELAVALTEIKKIAQNTFGLKGSLYYSFNLNGIKKLSYPKILDVVPDFVKYGTASIIPMGKKGLTAEKLTNITTLAAELTTLLAVPTDLESTSSAATIARHTLENSLYSEMKDMCLTGHIFYENTDIVKAADYIIYEKKAKVINRSGIVKSNVSTTRKTGDLVPKTRIRMKVSTGKSLEMYFGMTKTSPPSAKALTVVYNPNTFTSTTPAALGYDLAGGIIYLIIRNPNEDDDSKFLLKIG